MFATTVALACIPGERINPDCRLDDSPRRLDLTVAVDRRHLRADARLAEALGIRHGDALRGREEISERRRRIAGCTAALFDQIARIHDVSREQVALAATDREMWVDVLVVFLPAAVVYWLLCSFLADRIARNLLPDERTAARVVALLAAVFVSLFGLLLGEMWSWIVEMIRLSESHLSYRVARLPWVQHRPVIFALGIVVFVAVWWRRSRIGARRYYSGGDSTP